MPHALTGGFPSGTAQVGAVGQQSACGIIVGPIWPREGQAQEQDPDSPPDYPDSTILTIEQVAAWVGVSLDLAKTWPLPRLKLPIWADDRFSARQVRAYLEGRDWR